MNSIGGFTPDPSLNQRQLDMVGRQMSQLDEKRVQEEGAKAEVTKHTGDLHQKEVGEHSGSDQIELSGKASELTQQEEEQQASQAQNQQDTTQAQLNEQHHEHKAKGHGGHHHGHHNQPTQAGSNFAQQQSSVRTPAPRRHLSQSDIDRLREQQAEQSGENAHLAEESGVAPEHDGKKAEKDADKKANDHNLGEDAEAAAQEQVPGSLQLNGQQIDGKARPKTDEQRIEELRSGVPRENWEAAKVMVTNQIEANKPSNSLTDIKSPDNITPVSVEPEAYHPPLELCERRIGPLEPQFEEHEMAATA